VQVDVALDAGASLGEGPVWDAATNQLVWVDIDLGTVHRFRPGDQQTTAIHVGQEVGCAVPRAGGGLMLAMRDGFAALPRDGRSAELVAAVESDRPGSRMNDGACDGRGRFWAGTMSRTGGSCDAGLYRLDPDLRVMRVLGGVSVSNGIGWSPDHRSMYYVDSPLGRVDVFDFDIDTGALAGRRTLVDVPSEHGMPDGLAVDAEGFVWLALFGGGAVQRFGPDGRPDGRLELPVSRVTSCCFGDPDLSTLYITTASRGGEPPEPLAGALFACRPDVAGLPATPFAG
jgi:sugar lactone lactonase YvrE